MNKVALTIAGAVAAGVALAALGAGASSADPSSGSTYDVVGEPYAKAVAILRAQGVKTTFGGSVGSDVPEAQCVVKSQKALGTKMSLMLDCTAAANPQVTAAPSKTTGTSGTSGASGASGTSGASATQAPDAGGRPTPGAPGVVTVIPTRVG